MHLDFLNKFGLSPGLYWFIVSFNFTLYPSQYSCKIIECDFNFQSVETVSDVSHKPNVKVVTNVKRESKRVKRIKMRSPKQLSVRLTLANKITITFGKTRIDIPAKNYMEKISACETAQ